MTNEDADYLRSYSAGADIRAIPIGIDPDEFVPFVEDPAQPLIVLFVGNFRHSPNVEAARFLVREIAPKFPQIKFVIPGSHAPLDLQSESNVIFTGYVADTRDLYRRPNTIVAAPLFSGTGQRVKLLEAFSMGCPVITTSVGAMGFPIESGRQAIVADTVAAFRAALETLISSPSHRRKLGEQARGMILEQFTWDYVAEGLLSVVEETVISN